MSDRVDHLAEGIARGLRRAWKKRREHQYERQRVIMKQLNRLPIGQRVVVTRDHDGAKGRWVGVAAQIIEFNPLWPHPWLIRTSRGAEMYCSADMLIPQ